MKTISAGLKSLLASNESLIRVELLTITLQQGAGVYYYNSSDQDITYNGHTYLAGDEGVNPGFKRDAVMTSLGTDSKSMRLTLFCNPTTAIGGVLLPTFADYGGFDNAIIEIDCLPMLTWGVTTNGTYNIWTGMVGDVTADRTEVEIEVTSMLRLLQGAFPRNYTIPTCNNTLYDSACTMVKTSFQGLGTVAAGTLLTNQFTSNLTQANSYFDLGWVVWTSGQNNGLTRTVKTYLQLDGNFLVTVPLPYVPAVGDTFTAYAGCDKTQATCTTKFNNVIHYRGFPYMPNPITLFAGSGTGPVEQAVVGGPGTNGGGGGVSTFFKQQ